MAVPVELLLFSIGFLESMTGGLALFPVHVHEPHRLDPTIVIHIPVKGSPPGEAH